MSHRPEKKPILATCGDTGLKEYGGYIQEEFDPKLTGDRWLRKAREMADNEGSIASSLNAYENMIRGTKRTWRINDSGHHQAAHAQEVADQCWNDMESTTQTILSEAFSAARDGWSWLEVLFKLRKGSQDEPLLNSEFDDGLFGWRDISPRAQESRDHWEFGDDGQLLGMWQRPERNLPNKYGLLFIPTDRACHFRFKGRKDNPEGFAHLRPAWPDYYYASKLRELEGISLERNGAGLVVVELPMHIMDTDAADENLTTRAKYQELGRKLRVSSIGSVVMPTETDPNGRPTGYKLRLLSSSGKNNLEFDPVIKRYQVSMLKLFHTQFLDFGVNQEGSHALHSSATSMLGYGIASINKAIDEEINRSALSGLMRLNKFPRECWPALESADVEKQTLEATGAFLSSMISSGAMEPGKDLDDYARKQIGLDAKEGPSLDDMMAATAVPEIVTPILEADPSAGTFNDTTDTPEEPQPEGPMMDLEEAAEFLGVDRKKIMRAINSGKLPGIKIGNSFKVSRENLMNMMQVAA
jgi:excisionase family DNA binding protein